MINNVVDHSRRTRQQANTEIAIDKHAQRGQPGLCQKHPNDCGQQHQRDHFGLGQFKIIMPRQVLASGGGGIVIVTHGSDLLTGMTEFGATALQ